MYNPIVIRVLLQTCSNAGQSILSNPACQDPPSHFRNCHKVPLKHPKTPYYKGNEGPGNVYQRTL